MWSKLRVPGHPVLHSETLSQNKQVNKQNKTKQNTSMRKKNTQMGWNPPKSMMCEQGPDI